jgi:hypothetical protein
VIDNGGPIDQMLAKFRAARPNWPQDRTPEEKRAQYVSFVHGTMSLTRVGCTLTHEQLGEVYDQMVAEGKILP